LFPPWVQTKLLLSTPRNLTANTPTKSSESAECLKQTMLPKPSIPLNCKPHPTWMANKLPSATLKIIENGSHLFFIENADEFNRLVREFCQNRPQQRASLT